MEDSRMKKHVTVVGAIQIGFGVLGLIAAVAAFFALNFARTQVNGDEVAGEIIIHKRTPFDWLPVNTRTRWRYRAFYLPVVGKVSGNCCFGAGMSEYSHWNSQRCLCSLGIITG
jgi:hypothetical protein